MTGSDSGACEIRCSQTFHLQRKDRSWKFRNHHVSPQPLYASIVPREVVDPLCPLFFEIFCSDQTPPQRSPSHLKGNCLSSQVQNSHTDNASWEQLFASTSPTGESVHCAHCPFSIILRNRYCMSSWYRHQQKSTDTLDKKR